MAFIKKGETHTPAKEREIRRIIEESTGFTLPRGVLPCDSNVMLYCGYQFRPQIGSEDGGEYYTLAVSQTQELLFDTFMDLLSHIFNLASHARVVITREENFPYSRSKRSYNSNTYLPLFLSILPDFKDMFVEDGFVSLEISKGKPYMALQLSAHKTITVFAHKRELLFPVADFLKTQGIREKPHLTTLLDLRKIHSSSPEFERQFERLLAGLQSI